MISLVGRIIELYVARKNAKSDLDRALYLRQIEATDREIDRLV
jgi:hypothetical protein